MPSGNNTFLKHLIEDDFLGPLIFWDTSFPAAIILEVGDRPTAAIHFAEKLIKNKTHIVFSTHLCTEMFNLIVINKVKNGEGAASNNEAKKLLDKNPSIISSYQQEIENTIKAFQEFLGKFAGRFHSVLPTEPTVATSILETKSKYSLSAGDAIHIGTMLASQQRDIVGFDGHFKRIDGINIWSEFAKSVK